MSWLLTTARMRAFNSPKLCRTSKSARQWCSREASTTIRFGLPMAASVRLTVYDALGREITTLMNGEQAAGYLSVTWNGTNASGLKVASGLYFYRLEAQPANGNAPFVEMRKMLLVK